MSKFEVFNEHEILSDQRSHVNISQYTYIEMLQHLEDADSWIPLNVVWMGSRKHLALGRIVENKIYLLEIDEHESSSPIDIEQLRRPIYGREHYSIIIHAFGKEFCNFRIGIQQNYIDLIVGEQ